MANHMAPRKRWSRKLKLTVSILGLMAISLGAWAIVAALTAGTVDVSTADLQASVDPLGAFTNDDGVVDGSDTGDNGDDPLAYGMTAARDGAFASCTVDAAGNSVDVTIANGYADYYCTLNTKFQNDGTTELRLQNITVTDGGGGDAFTPGVEVEVIPDSGSAGCGKTLPSGGISQNTIFGVGLLAPAAGATYDIVLSFEWVPTGLYAPGNCTGF